MPHSDQGTITRCGPYSETSQLVTWFTAGHGILRTIAKGSSRPKQPLHGKIDLHHHGHLQWSPSRSSQLHTLTSFDLQNLHRGITLSYPRALAAAYCFDLIAALVEPEHPEPQLYDLHLRAIHHLDSHEPNARLIERFETRVFQQLGLFRPDLPTSTQRRLILPRIPHSLLRLQEIFNV